MTIGGRLLTIGGHAPHVDPRAWVAPDATVAGDVTIGADTSVWYSASIRAEVESVRIGAIANVQDCAVIHVDSGYPATIGDEVSVGHGAVLHGCTVHRGTVIGMRAVVLNGAVIGEGCLVAAGAVVLEGVQVPAGSLVAGVPGRVVRSLSANKQQEMLTGIRLYPEFARMHRTADRG